MKEPAGRGVSYGKMKNKKAQMKIQQMAFMLIAVTLFFVFAGLFFAMIVFSDVRRTAEELEQRDALLLVSKLANSPEFACGNAFGSFRTNCIDSDKAMALKNNIDRYEDLKGNFWGVEGIEIRKIYPLDYEEECDSGNYPECGKITVIKKQGIGVSNFVALCRKENVEGFVEDKCEMARVVVYYGGSS
jgi:hypothetical protein